MRSKNRKVRMELDSRFRGIQVIIATIPPSNSRSVTTGYGVLHGKSGLSDTPHSNCQYFYVRRLYLALSIFSFFIPATLLINYEHKLYRDNSD